MIGRSTVDQIHIIKQLAEKSHEFNKDVPTPYVHRLQRSILGTIRLIEKNYGMS
jgi:hypothetical protein